jgi:hypothetical protein
MKYTTITDDPASWPDGDGWVLVWPSTESAADFNGPSLYRGWYVRACRSHGRGWSGCRWARIANPFDEANAPEWRHDTPPQEDGAVVEVNSDFVVGGRAVRLDAGDGFPWLLTDPDGDPNALPDNALSKLGWRPAGGSDD